MDMDNNGILHVHSMYSLNDSTSTPEEIVVKAKELGFKNVTLTDHGTLLGIEHFIDAGKKHNINAIPGVETYLTNRMHFILIAKNHKGYQSICYAMRDANTQIEKVKKLTYPIMSNDIIEKYFKGNDDVIATTACIQGPVGYMLLSNKRKLKKVEKNQKICDETYGNYMLWKELDADLRICTKEISDLKKKRTSLSKFLKPAYKKRLETLKSKSLNSAKDSEKYNKALEDYKNAESELPLIEEKLARKEQVKISSTEDRDKYKDSKNKYEKNKKIIDAIEISTDEELYNLAKKEVEYFKSVFPNFFLEVQYHGLEDEAYVMPIIAKLSKETNTPLIAANDSHMIDNSEENLEARRIVRYNYFNQSQEINEADKELYLKTNDELYLALIQVLSEDDVIQAISNLSILNDCKVEFPDGKHYPSVKSNKTIDDMLKIARDEAIAKGIWNEEYEQRSIREVDTIKSMGYVDYHMVVQDFCEAGRLLGRIPKEELANVPTDFSKVFDWIKEKKFIKSIGVGPGRGSAAGSLVCNQLGITNIDPIKYDLFFERFLNPERVSMPDIDTDIKTSIRPLIIKYLKWKYGERSVCSIATETTYGAKGAIQMAGRERASQLYKDLPKQDAEKKQREYLNTITLKLSDEIPEIPNITLSDCEKEIEWFIECASENIEEFKIIYQRAKLIEGKLSGTGVHAGGVIISDNDNVNDYIPLAYNTDKDVWVAQCDMIKAEEKGLLKMDLLGLGTLDCIADTLQLIYKHYGIEIDIDAIKFEDDVFKEIFANGNTNSIFQFESQGMKSMLRDFKPTCFEDLILLVACYRPGPMQYLEDIIEIKNGRKPLTYKTPELEDILSSTYGATVYQEQVMTIFQKLAGYSLGGADLVRRAMSKKKTEKLEIERKAFIYGDEERGIDGCVKRGIDENVANVLFDEMMDFAKYAFNKSHAAAYALVAYQTAWLKHYYPLEYMCAMFNNKEQEKFEPLIEDCKYYGINILQPSINHSYYNFVIEDKSIRYGYRGVKGIGEANEELINNICNNRNENIYVSYRDFLKRNVIRTIDKNGEDKYSIIDKGLLETMMYVGFFDEFKINRTSVTLTETLKSNDYKYLCRLINEIQVDEVTPMDKGFNLDKELELLSFIVSDHPLIDYGDDIKYKCTPINQMGTSNKAQESIFGYVSSAISKTSAKGNDMYILDVLGKTGTCTVFVMNRLYNAYTLGELVHKVIKVTGSPKNGNTMFASSIKFLAPSTDDLFAEINTRAATELLVDILDKDNEERTNCVKLMCYYLGKSGNLHYSLKPRMAERYLSDDEIELLKQNGIKFQKWNTKE